MRYKTDDISSQWHTQEPPAALHLLAILMDWYRRWCLDGKPLTITDYISPRPNKSYHPKGNAFDGRTNDFENTSDRARFFAFAQEAAVFVNRWFLSKRGVPGELQIETHPELWNTPNQHIHVELDDGHPV